MTESKNKQVNLELSVGNHFISFITKDITSSSVFHCRKNFEKILETESLTSTIKLFFEENDLNPDIVANVKLFLENDLFTLVPDELFDEKEKRTYLKYITRVKKNDFISYDNIEELKIKNVYIPYVNVNNFLVDKFKNINYYHFNSVLIKKIFKIRDNKSFFAYVDNKKVKIMIFNKDNLFFFNSYEINTGADIVYFILLTLKEKDLNVDETLINFIIDSKNDDLYDLANKFFNNFKIINDKKTDFLYSE